MIIYRGIGAPKHVMVMPNVFRKVESKHIFMMWFAICLCYGYLLWEDWRDAVRERKWWITNLVWHWIYEENGLNFWVCIHGVIIPKSDFGSNELVLT